MERLSFDIQWEQAEGVTHPGLAASWARTVIRVGGRSVTMVQDTRTNASRTAIYGPAMLLAEWAVRNFWFLLNEAEHAEARGYAWRRRHSLAAAREGTSLPDLRIFRDEHAVVAEWVARTDAHHLPVRFVDQGRAELEPTQARAALSELVDTVLERLRDIVSPDIDALRADWESTLEVSGEDLHLCERAARLGLDALDESQLSPDLESCLRGAVDDLPRVTANDVLDAQIREAAALASAVASVRDLTVNGGMPPLRAGSRDLEIQVPSGHRPYVTGYAAAKALRTKHHLPVGKVDLDRLAGHLGLDIKEHPPLGKHGSHLQGLVGESPTGAPLLYVAPRRKEPARFLQARGLFAMLAGATREGPRALTSAGTTLQAAGRAFAAELLAPAEFLVDRVADGYDDDVVEQLAEELEVAVPVIVRQLENLERHGLSM